LPAERLFFIAEHNEHATAHNRLVTGHSLAQ
jgi:hypothetical protein